MKSLFVHTKKKGADGLQRVFTPFSQTVVYQSPRCVNVDLFVAIINYVICNEVDIQVDDFGG